MSQWYSACQSNWFKVKDAMALIAWAVPFDVKIDTQATADGGTAYRFTASDDAGLPSRVDEDVDGNELDPIDITEEIHEHLAEGEVCVIYEVGFDGNGNAPEGHAWAIHSNGDCIRLALDDIQALAAIVLQGKSLT